MSERVPEPLEMSDTEIVDFIGQECYGLEYESRGWKITVGFDSPMSFPGKGFRDAICLAAGKWKEDHGDF